jgi:cell division protein FtsZ
MIHFDLPRQKSSIIKVLGVGGGGSNAVNFMFDQQIEGVDFIICNTDAKAIEQSPVPNKVQLGPHLTQGLGAGANPEIGKMATEESLEEIRRILEVNTKMAFITVGMGGGTGTGGAPIIAQICKEMGILTVGIVTTPFAFEGPRRLQQAQEGIRQLKPLVDTLLVISNDKLRVQYGDLKMKEAFGKADNVLATAAKCITDIINSRGHIIVDFADVCTVMKNGGVAILGKAEVAGENRAQMAIEQALASPLLNDSDIMGAKWILININSAEGDFECTMDEMEIINNYLRQQAGPETDVIVGMGYDAALGEKIGITLVATGFEHKDPFQPTPERVVKKDNPEKIVMTLGLDTPAQAPTQASTQVPAQAPTQTPTVTPATEAVMPQVVELPILETTSLIRVNDIPEEMDLNIDLDIYPFIEASMREEEQSGPVHFELSTEITSAIDLTPIITSPEIAASHTPVQDPVADLLQFTVSNTPSLAPPQPGRQGLLSKPARIYEEPEVHEKVPVAVTPVREVTPPVVPVNSIPAQESPVAPAPESIIPDLIREINEQESIEEMPMQLIMKEGPSQRMPAPNTIVEDHHFNEEEEQKRRAADRIQKLRNLSFNLNNPADPNNEFDMVPAYVRKNMELFGNTLTSVEQFYSKVTVGKDENDQPKFSTRNTFLEGKKPD